MKRYLFLFLTISLLAFSCSKNEDEPTEENDQMYFPPVSGNEWETVTPEDLNWNTDKLDNLYSFLEENRTRAFIVLYNGKIVLEQYWGKNILNTANFTAGTQWYWASAGKTLSAFLIGIAQQEDYLNINDKTSDYLGNGWTSLSSEKESLITIRHQLTMTTGLDYTVPDSYCTDPECLQYKTDAGDQWYYHNAPYTLLKDVISEATGVNHQEYTDQKLETPTGMNGTWIFDGDNNVYWSVPRDMARFGILIQNKGKWNATEVLSDQQYFTEMTTTSQNLNPAYGYLWWLNGKDKIIAPGFPLTLNTELAPDAPDDLILAAGKNGQFLGVIPSLNLVVVRMGESPDGTAVPIQFHNEMWQKLNPVIGR